jgi:hypothetical protein
MTPTTTARWPTSDSDPRGSLWVLEIQIRHPNREFGAFFEDLLLEDDELQAFSFSRPSPEVGPCAG